MDEPDAQHPWKPGYVYVQLADLIAEQIAVGRLQPGAMLPGERALAAEYGVGVNTVRGAIRVLRERGLVVTYPAKGTYVAELPE